MAEVSADATPPDPNPEYTLVTRAGWGAQEPKEPLKPLDKPVPHVLLAYDTEVASCSTKDECKERMRELQKKQMDKGLPDLLYNFLVGGDGNLYEGRGWDFQPEPLDGQPQYDNKSIVIGFLGDGEDFDPEEPFLRLDQAMAIPNDGIESGLVERDYLVSDYAEKDSLYDY